MKIQQLYDKDIARRINPAVVVSEMVEYFIHQEIDEYVFTVDITKEIYKFLNAVANKKEGKTGVWISGYYGSGKSHFIKYLFYCLNEKYREKALKNFKNSLQNVNPLDEPNIGLVTSLEKKLGELQIDEIIFNIDAVSDRDGVKDRITRVLLNQLNKFRGLNDTNIALALYLEKPLAKNGVFEEFKSRIKSTFGDSWDGNQIRFIRMYLDNVLDIAKEFDPQLDKAALKTSILDRNQDYTIEFLIDELKDYLIDKSDNYRLLFLIDEISQYVGSDTSLLLNLQTIIEELGSQIGTKVWVVCTAQQDLSNLINNTDKKTEDFGKILGRFETMISLQSQDAAYITKKRVLDKNSEGLGALIDYYQENKGAIENQFIFDHDLYENYSHRDDFCLTYPFIPYQFRLISDVFESFSNVGYVGEGVKNTERAILGITHYTANKCAEEQVGYFVPFDLFFNEQFINNLTHHARSMLDRAYNIEQVKSDYFARRVVNTLFMVSNLGESQSVNFPANVENLSLLLMDTADMAKQEMQNKVQEVLDLLVTKNIIQVSEGKYRFYKEDEIEVAQLIKNTTITNEDRLSYFYDDIIQKHLKPSPRVTFGNNTFRKSLKVDDKEFGSKGDFEVKFSIYDATELDQLAHTIPSNDLLIGISEWFNSITDLKAKIADYVRTQKFIKTNVASATGRRKETLENFRNTNKSLLNEIQLRFEQNFMQTAIISKNQVILASELKGSTPSARYTEMLQRHLEEVYKKHSLSNGYATSNADFQNHAKSAQTQHGIPLTPAEDELNSKLNLLGGDVVVGDIVKDFEKPPYGWKDISTLDVLLSIAHKGLRRFEWRNETIELTDFVAKAINSRERDAITIHKEKVHSAEDLRAFIDAVNNQIFAKTLIPNSITDFKEATETFKIQIEPLIKELNQQKEHYEFYPFSYYLKNYYQALSEIYQARNIEQMAELVIRQVNTLKVARDINEQIREFLAHNFEAYSEITSFVENNKNNFASLDEGLQVRAKELSDYLKSNREPWNKFPQMKKAYKELIQAINTHKTALNTRVSTLYQHLLEEVEAKQQELGVSNPQLKKDLENTIYHISQEDQLTQLELHEARANEVRADYLKSLDDQKAEEEAAKTGTKVVVSRQVSLSTLIKPSTLSTEEEVDTYLNELRKKLMKQLSEHQKIFLK